jgi:hypothetical protein
MEELRQRISRMADTDEIKETLEEFLYRLVKPLLEHHPYAPSQRITVSICRSSSRRIAVGDWVEYRGGSSRLTAQIGQEKSLGRVVGLDKLNRPRLRWYDGQGWKKPYSFIEWSSSECTFSEDSEVRMLFPYQAAAQFLEAFACYPIEAEEETAPHDAVVSHEESDEFPVPEADGAPQYSISEYYREWAIWTEPRKRVMRLTTPSRPGRKLRHRWRPFPLEAPSAE